jgi:hypothetical protein
MHCPRTPEELRPHAGDLDVCPIPARQVRARCVHFQISQLLWARKELLYTVPKRARVDERTRIVVLPRRRPVDGQRAPRVLVQVKGGWGEAVIIASHTRQG